VSNAYFYQVLADRDAERVLPSVEELLKKSFHQTDVKLTEVASFLSLLWGFFSVIFSIRTLPFPYFTKLGIVQIITF
jgi:hypothetical protein